MKLHKSHECQVGSIACQDQLEELWAIDSAAYGAASITYDKFREWWRGFPSGLQVLHWQQRIGGAMGLWPLSDRSAARLINAQIKESALTGRMMRPVVTRTIFWPRSEPYFGHASELFPHI